MQPESDTDDDSVRGILHVPPHLPLTGEQLGWGVAEQVPASAAVPSDWEPVC